MKVLGENLVLLQRIAFGGMAEIYRGKQIGVDGFEKTVAIKAIHPHLANAENFKKMFKIEANLSAKLQHPNIVQVYSNGEAEGQLYLVMEYVEGCNLNDFLRKSIQEMKAISVEVACHVVAECAEGLYYAHSYSDEATGQHLNIVHRDISPQNIMIGFKGEIKLVDFGIVKAEGNERTQTGLLKGKFSYMAPEQIHGEELDGRSDIFSLGIVLWEILAQQRLFASTDELKTMKRVSECSVEPPSRFNPNVNSELDAIVLKALSKKREDRYSKASDFSQALQTFLNKSYPDFNKNAYRSYIQSYFVKEIAESAQSRKDVELEGEKVISQLHSKLSHADRTSMANEEQVTQLSQVQMTFLKRIQRVIGAGRWMRWGLSGIVALVCVILLYMKYIEAKSLIDEPDANIRRLAQTSYVKQMKADGLALSTLLPPNSVWRYSDFRHMLGPEWELTKSPSETWQSGMAPLGYGDAEIRTTLDYGGQEQKKLTTYYFHKRFQLPENLIFHPQMLLRARIDDGAVIYINGQEIARMNMPSGEIDSRTFSTECVADRDEKKYAEIKFDKDKLVKGINALAIEVHQCNERSTDLFFDMEIIGASYK